MNQEDAEAIVRAHYEAYNDHDFERGAALIGDQLEWLIVPFEVTLHSSEEYKQFFAGWSVTSPDARIDVVNVATAGSVVVGEYVFRGRQTGVLRAAQGDIPPTGELMNVPVCDVFFVENNKIVQVRSYFDVATLMRQLGLIT